MPVNGGSCRDCQATVEWVTTEKNGRPMPLDIGEDPGGNVVMVQGPNGLRARVFGHGVTPDVPGPRRVPHSATCPRDDDPVLTRKRRHARTNRRRYP